MEVRGCKEHTVSHLALEIWMKLTDKVLDRTVPILASRHTEYIHTVKSNVNVGIEPNPCRRDLLYEASSQPLSGF